MIARVDTYVTFNYLTHRIDNVAITPGAKAFAQQTSGACAPSTIRHGNFVPLIAKNGELEVVLLGETFMAAHGTPVNSNNFSVTKLGDYSVLISETTGFFSATQRIIFWVKIDYQPSALVVFEAMNRTMLVW